MATLPGNAILGVAPATGESYAFAAKTRMVFDPVTTQTLGPQLLYQMRAKDTGAGFVAWLSNDPSLAYPGVPVGVIVDKQIAARLV